MSENNELMTATFTKLEKVIDKLIDLPTDKLKEIKSLLNEVRSYSNLIEREKQNLESKFQIITEITSDFTYEFEVSEVNKLKLIWIDGAFRKITGFTVEESEARGGFAKLFIPEDRPIIERRRNNLFNGKDDESEFRIRCKDGSIKWLRDYGKPILKNGEVVGVVGGATDITAERKQEEELERNYAATLNLVEDLSNEIEERKIVEETLSESEEKFRSLAESAKVIISIINENEDSKYLYVNREWEKISGYSKNETDKIRPIDLVHPDMKQQVMNYSKMRTKGNSAPNQYEMKVITKSGEVKWLDFSSTAIKFGKIPAILTTAIDITERKREEAKVKKLSEIAVYLAATTYNQSIYKYISDTTHELLGNNGVVLTTELNHNDLEWRIKSIAGLSKSAETISNILGVNPAELKGKATPEMLENLEHGKVSFIGSEISARTFNSIGKRAGAKIQKLLGIDGIYSIPFRIGPDSTGTITILKTKKLQTIDYKLLEVFVNYISVYLQKASSYAEIKESEAKYRSLFENQLESYAYHEIILDKKNKPVDYRFIDVNDKFLEQTGFTKKEDAIGKTVRELWSNIDDFFIDIYGGVALTGQPKTFEHFSTPLKKYYRVNAYSPKKGFFATSFLDITEAKLAENELKESEYFANMVADSTPALLYIYDVEKQKNIWTNNNHKQFFREVNRLTNEFHFDTIAEIIDPDDFQKVISETEKLIKNPSLQNFKLDIRVKKGKDRIWMNLIVSQFKIGKDGFVTQLIGAMFDISDRKAAEENLKENQHLLSNSQKIGNMGSWEIDIKTYNVKWTAQNYKIFDYPEGEEISYDKFLARVHPDDKEYVNQQWLEGIKTKNYDIKHRLLINGNVKWLREKADFELDSDGIPTKAIGFTQDITEIKVAGAKLKESETRTRAIFENSLSGIFLTDTKGKILEVNKAMIDMLGSPSVEETKKINVLKFKPLREIGYAQAIENAITTGEIQKGENKYKSKWGKEFIINYYFVPITDENRKTQNVLAVVEDVSELRTVQKNLIESENRFRLFMKNLPAGISIKDVNGVYQYINKFTEDTFGIKNWEGKKTENFFDKETTEKLTESDKAVLKEKVVFRESSLVDKEGKLRHFETTQFLIPTKDKNLIGIVSLDVTDKVKAEKASLEADQKLRHVMLNSTNMFYQHDTEHQITFVSPQVKDILGYTREEALINWTKLASDNPINKIGFEHTVKAIKTGIAQPTYQLELLHKNGIKVWVEVREVPVKENGKVTSIVGSLVDITESKAAEDALKESEEKYRAIFENSQIGIFRTRISDGKLVLANQKMAELFGYNTIQGAERYYSTSEHYVNPDDRQKLLELLKTEGKFDNFIAPLTTRKGDVRWFQYSGRLFEAEGYIEGVATDITEQIEFENELKERKQFIETVMDNLPIGVALNSIDKGDAFYMNPQFENIYGWPKEEIKDIADFFNKVYPDKNYREKLITQIMADINSGDLSRMHWEKIEITQKNGKKRIIDAVNIPLPDQNTMVSTVIDVTNEHEFKEELKSRNEFIQTILDNLPIGISLNNSGTNKTFYTNRKFEEIYGWPTDEINDTEKFFTNIFPDPVYRNTMLTKISNDLKRKDSKNLRWEECFVTTKNGDKKVVNIDNIKMDNRSTIVTTTIDVTGEHQYREEVNKSRIRYKEKSDFFKLLADNSPDFLWAKDLEGRYTFANKAICEKLLNTKNLTEPIGKTYAYFAEKALKSRKRKNWFTFGENTEFHDEAVLKNQKTVRFESDGLVNGKYLCVDISKALIYDDDSNVVGIVGSGKVITEQKIAEKERELQEIAIKESEAKFRATAEGSIDEFYLYEVALNPNKTIRDFVLKDTNSAAREQRINPKISTINSDLKHVELPQIYKKIFPDYKMVFRTKVPFEKIFSFTLAGVTKWYRLQTIPVANGIAVFRREITNLVESQLQLEEYKNELLELNEYLQTVREEERGAISREIHDDLGQSLAAIKIDLNRIMKNFLTNEPELYSEAKRLVSLVDLSIKSVHNICAKLRPDILDDFGISVAIDWLAQEMFTKAGIKYKLNFKPQDLVIESELQTALFRIFQEATTNIIKHAEATLVKIQLIDSDQNITLRVIDNGKGIKLPKAKKQKQFGILGMKERVNVFNGEIKISDRKNGGTEIFVQIPKKIK
ncbi:MAG: PAS domain S-box protein [Melioribacteraceae bacterium]|nr:PAS domain S-box protein [Melioribacteraceae bacterium]MCF8265830.1 PAS domain S-box protein [Melioribacteraceae bacterium]